jgi:hypothetical protein
MPPCFQSLHIYKKPSWPDLIRHDSIIVMPGLDPGIHVFLSAVTAKEDVDGRVSSAKTRFCPAMTTERGPDKAGHDDDERATYNPA